MYTFLTFCVFVFCCCGSEVLAIGARYPRSYTDCDYFKAIQISEGEIPQSDSYEVFLSGSKPIKVNCRFDRSVNFTTIMQRKDGTLSFDQGYNEYRNGFGQHNLTVTLQDWDHNIKTVRYTRFIVGPESDRFRLSIGGYQSGSVLPDDFGFNNGCQFATKNNTDPNGCAVGMSAGWWYNYCTHTLPTGKYYPGGNYIPSGGLYDGIYYKDWHDYMYSLKYIRLELSKN